MLATQEIPFALQELLDLLGREQPLDVVHNAIRRTVGSIRPVVESGAALVTCSDEFNGEIRGAFDRDVVRMLTSPRIPSKRRLFSVANLGGRVEPGALKLLDDHFSALSQKQGHKLLLVEIASHVGKREAKPEPIYGELDRFGRISPCCGALTLLLENPASTAAVRHPWFEQLSAFFGPERLAALRQDSTPHRMVRTAIVHAVLQAETALVDLLREPPRTPTFVLLVALVAVNQSGLDGAMLVGVHQVAIDDGVARIEHGASLRSTPSAIRIHASGARLVATTPDEEPDAEAPPARATGPAANHGAELARAFEQHTRAHRADPRVRAHVAATRAHLHQVKQHPHAQRIYARPLLRAFLQGLALLAPELGLVAFALQSGRDLVKAERAKRLLEKGPRTDEARRLLHEMEAELQQLGHREAREVLEILLAESSPFVAP